MSYRKLKPFNDVDGYHLGYVMWCPGCEEEHLFRTEDWIMHDGKKDDGWKFNGDMDLPTFSPSLHINAKIKAECCHFILKDGIIDFFGDCYHELKNKKVPLPEHFPPNQFYLNKPAF